MLLNKPKDYVTTSDDPQQRKTVMDLVKNACHERIYPVGRLDRNTTGVLLLTNDDRVSGIDALYESVSAFGTVGLTTGITQILSPVSKLCLCLTMFIGRVGPVSLGLAIAGKKSRKAAAVRPEGKVIVG